MKRRFRPKLLYLTEDTADIFQDHGAAILLLVREGGAKDFRSLCKAYGYRVDSNRSPVFSLKGAVETLVAAGLMESANKHLGPYRLCDSLDQLLGALGISLSQAANLPSIDGLATLPFHGRPDRWYTAPHVFVLMPFAEIHRHVYDGPIKQACNQLNITVERADDIFSADSLMSDIWTSIYNSGVIVADCTDKNPNVFYEVGVSHTIGKPVVLISQRKEDVPSDVSYIRYIQYSTTRAGMRKLTSDLRKTLKAVGKGIWD